MGNPTHLRAAGWRAGAPPFPGGACRQLVLHTPCTGLAPQPRVGSGQRRGLDGEREGETGGHPRDLGLCHIFAGRQMAADISPDTFSLYSLARPHLNKALRSQVQAV